MSHKTLEQMRAGAELMGERYTSGYLHGWDVCSGYAVYVRVDVTLVPGYGSDHLFDRTLARAAELIETTLASQLCGKLPDSNGRAAVKITREHDGEIPEAPAWVKSIAEKAASKRRRIWS